MKFKYVKHCYVHDKANFKTTFLFLEQRHIFKKPTQCVVYKEIFDEWRWLHSAKPLNIIDLFFVVNIWDKNVVVPASRRRNKEEIDRINGIFKTVQSR